MRSQGKYYRNRNNCVPNSEFVRYMTIHKQPDVVGVMKFRRYVDGKVVEQMETSSIDFDQAESMAKDLDK